MLPTASMLTKGTEPEVANAKRELALGDAHEHAPPLSHGGRDCAVPYQCAALGQVRIRNLQDLRGILVAAISLDEVAV